MRIGLYGGSFDPVHWGHIRPIQEARESLELDQVLYLPTGRPPHKAERHAGARRLLAAPRRFAMVELALLNEEGLFVSPYELSEESTSYTVHSLEHFRETQPNDEFFLLMGADSWHNLESWREWRRILELVEIGVLVRPGWELPELDGERAEAVDRGRVHFIHNRPLPLASRRIRAALANGEPLSPDELPPQVLEYVQKYDLYRSNAEPVDRH